MSSAPQKNGPEPRKSVFIKSYGCQMNVYDATRMADVLDAQGYDEVDTLEAADLVILNTCHIRERASEKVFSELGKVRVAKQARAKQGLSMNIAVAGCVAQAEGKEILRRQKAVDLVVGPQNYHLLPQMLSRLGTDGAQVDTDFPTEDKFDHLAAPTPRAVRARGISAFLTIQEGCDKFCSFCVVPYTRGAEYSRPIAKILSEAEPLIDHGVREFTLLGQNVNAYNGLNEAGQPSSLVTLLQRLSGMEGIKRLRYTTSHPNDMSPELIAAHGDMEKLMPFLHLPVQSGSDRILSAMNRRHSAEDYLRIVRQLRAVRPDIALSSDFIVGFPGETEKDFRATLALIAEVDFASSFFFKYSPRPGTPAADSDEQVAEEVKSERLVRLQDLVETQRHAYNRSKIGETLEVLLEKPGRHPGQLSGKTAYLQPVLVEASRDLIGQVVPVAMTHVNGNCLFGTLALTGQST